MRTVSARVAGPTLRRGLLRIASVTLLGLAACKRPSDRPVTLTKDQERVVEAALLKQLPSDLQTTPGLQWAGKLALVGWRLDPPGTSVRPGEKRTLSLVWQADQPPQGAWNLAVRLVGPGSRQVTLDHPPISGLLPVAQWQPKQLVQDETRFALPVDLPPGALRLVVGLVAGDAKTQPQRLPINHAPEGMTTTDGLAQLTVLEVPMLQRAVAPPGVRHVLQPTAEPLTMDGRLLEAAWQAPGLGKLQTPTGQPLDPAMATDVRFTWDADFLYVGAKLQDANLRNIHIRNDDMNWEGDMLELFLQVPGRPDYLQFEWTPAGATLDAHYTAYRTPAWQEAARFQSDMKSQVLTSGNVNLPGLDTSWTLEAAIPWRAIGVGPLPGLRLLANVYRVDDSDSHDMGKMAAWVPLGGDFHRLAGAGTLVLAGPDGQVLAPPPTRPRILPNGQFVAPPSPR